MKWRKSLNDPAIKYSCAANILLDVGMIWLIISFILSVTTVMKLQPEIMLDDIGKVFSLGVLFILLSKVVALIKHESAAG